MTNSPCPEKKATIDIEVALGIYLNYSKHGLVTLERIMRWDQKKSLRENSITIGMSVDQAKTLVKCYHLNYRKVRIQACEKSKPEVPETCEFGVP